MNLLAALLVIEFAAGPRVIDAAVVSPLQVSQPPEIRVLTVNGVINPLTARYLDRELEAAGSVAHVTAVVVQLNTPGGVETSMRDMVEVILGARVPVVVYVTPAGARAASAGMFVVQAAHVAAMAPGTNIGAAHPVTIGVQQPDTTLAEKMVSDAAALARAIAEQRGRNAEWAELAVRTSVSVTAREAMELNVIDLVVDDLDQLLPAIEGRPVATAAGEAVIHAAAARVVVRPMSLPERIVHAITDPNIAYLLLTIGLIGIIAELYNPGTIVGGATGVMALILAFVAFDSLPVNWAGVVLLVLGIGLFVADLATEGIGVPAVGGLVAFVLGSLMLYSPFTPPSPVMPDVSVSPWLAGGVAAGLAALLLGVGRALLRARHEPVASGEAALLGRVGTAETRLAPHGTVRIDSETWSAAVDEPAGEIGPGEPVEVVALEGVVLLVRKYPGNGRPSQEEA